MLLSLGEAFPGVQAMSLVAFKGENRSDARYAASNEKYLTQGTGIATQMALIVNWSEPPPASSA
jgi:hypothetical protein